MAGPATTVPSGQISDASRLRIRDSSGNSPMFTSGGVVSGRIEIKPSGGTQWGTIQKFNWDNNDALVACREIGNELGYKVTSGTELYSSSTPDGSGEIW